MTDVRKIAYSLPAGAAHLEALRAEVRAYGITDEAEVEEIVGECVGLGLSVDMLLMIRRTTQGYAADLDRLVAALVPDRQKVRLLGTTYALVDRIDGPGFTLRRLEG